MASEYSTKRTQVILRKGGTPGTIKNPDKYHTYNELMLQLATAMEEAEKYKNGPGVTKKGIEKRDEIIERLEFTISRLDIPNKFKIASGRIKSAESRRQLIKDLKKEFKMK